jgi:hypothetical protein
MEGLESGSNADKCYPGVERRKLNFLNNIFGLLSFYFVKNFVVEISLSLE